MEWGKEGPVDSGPPDIEPKRTRVHRGHAGIGRIAAAIGWLVHRREAAPVRRVLAERDERRRYKAAAARRAAQLRGWGCCSIALGAAGVDRDLCRTLGAVRALLIGILGAVRALLLRRRLR